MNRALLILLFFIVGFISCKKQTDEVAIVKAQAAKDDKIIQDYIVANNLITTAKRVDTTGVYYVVISPGTGNGLFTNSTQVTVDYTGKILTTGQLFAQSNNFHPSFILSEVIKGWQLGIPKIKKGGTVRLLIPSRYGYGPFNQPSINLPANSVLDFNIQLLDITN